MGEEEDEAVRRIQAVQRGRAARQAVGKIRQEQEEELVEQAEAAVRIQAMHRGQQARFVARRGDFVHELV